MYYHIKSLIVTKLKKKNIYLNLSFFAFSLLLFLSNVTYCTNLSKDLNVKSSLLKYKDKPTTYLLQKPQISDSENHFINYSIDGIYNFLSFFPSNGIGLVSNSSNEYLENEKIKNSYSIINEFVSNMSSTSHNFFKNMSIAPYDGYLNSTDPEDIGIAIRGVAHAIKYFSSTIGEITGYVNETELNIYGKLYYASKAVFFSNYFFQRGVILETEDSIVYPQAYLNNQTDAMLNSYVLYLFILTNDILDDLGIPNSKYLISAYKVLNSFSKDIDDLGGVHVTLSSDTWWYPHHEKERFVLNGHIWAMINLYNFYVRTGDLSAYKYYRRGLNAIYKLIPLFLSNTTQMYDLVGNDANYKYQALHVIQLDWLYEVSNIGLFKYYHDLFLESYIISTGSILEVSAQIINNSYLNIEGKIHWSRNTEGPNGLYVRSTMLLEGYYHGSSYTYCFADIALREKRVDEKKQGSIDPNSYAIQSNIDLNGSKLISIESINFDFKYIYVILAFNNFVIPLSEPIIIQNKYLENLLMIPLIFGFFILDKLYHFYKKKRCKS